MTYEYQQYLAHHGIKGQKWGDRRYQNEDGSLTEEGKMRYGVGQQQKSKRRLELEQHYLKKGYRQERAEAAAEFREREEKKKRLATGVAVASVLALGTIYGASYISKHGGQFSLHNAKNSSQALRIAKGFLAGAGVGSALRGASIGLGIKINDAADEIGTHNEKMIVEGYRKKHSNTRLTDRQILDRNTRLRMRQHGY